MISFVNPHAAERALPEGDQPVVAGMGDAPIAAVPMERQSSEIVYQQLFLSRGKMETLPAK